MWNSSGPNPDEAVISAVGRRRSRPAPAGCFGGFPDVKLRYRASVRKLYTSKNAFNACMSAAVHIVCTRHWKYRLCRLAARPGNPRATGGLPPYPMYRSATCHMPTCRTVHLLEVRESVYVTATGCTTTCSRSLIACNLYRRRPCSPGGLAGDCRDRESALAHKTSDMIRASPLLS